MGVVMAEASQVSVIHEEPEEEEDFDQEVDDYDHPRSHKDDDVAKRTNPIIYVGDEVGAGSTELANATYNFRGWKSNNHDHLLSRQKQLQHKRVSSLTSAALEGLEEYVSKTRQHQQPIESTVITIGNSKNDSDLRHVVRYFRSNCSSAAGSVVSMGETSISTSLNNSSCGTGTSTGGSGTMSWGGGTAATATRKHRRRKAGQFPVRISFVPLDPDQPLQDQHGGNFDLILHKLTEDILSCSLQNYQDDEERAGFTQEELDRRNQDPCWKRVQALQDYYHRNNHCCMVDDPRNVQTVMSRSAIANVLQHCLQDVKTASGIPVKSPRFVVIPDHDDPQQRVYDLKSSLHKNQGMTTPLIVKPLIAAGTKQSHSMIVALQESAFLELPPKSIVQEFVNHDATLYKVYVLGDFVSVYERHSLPNLPDDLSTSTVDLVKFDSQRPYPKLQDFGLGNKESNIDSSDTTSPAARRTAVTVEEVKPVVHALKAAFGLELFGFDILRRINDTEWLVVDVNYFPSYKEVPNFPSLLARYLSRRVLEQRRKDGSRKGSVDGG
jgi:inositol-1,3,4-trisphosphate 5/6-kinase/inositol-tetrakisphosphate 1-kinase